MFVEPNEDNDLNEMHSHSPCSNSNPDSTKIEQEEQESEVDMQESSKSNGTVFRTLFASGDVDIAGSNVTIDDADADMEKNNDISVTEEIEADDALVTTYIAQKDSEEKGQEVKEEENDYEQIQEEDQQRQEEGEEVETFDSPSKRRPVSVSPEDLPKVLEIVDELEKKIVEIPLSPFPSTPDSTMTIVNPDADNEENKREFVESTTSVTPKRKSSFLGYDNTAVAETSEHKKPYEPSSRLMKTTQARIMDSLVWEEQKHMIKPEDDPWWDRRGSKSDGFLASHQNKICDAVESKYNAPTTAYLASKRQKALLQPEDPSQMLTKGIYNHYNSRSSSSDENDKMSSEPQLATKKVIVQIKKISKDSNLLKATHTTAMVTKKSGTPEAGKPLRLVSEIYGTGPKDVKSRFTELRKETKVANEMYKNSPLSVNSITRKIKETSPSLLKPNKSSAAGRRDKYVAQANDPREQGWNEKYIKCHIPNEVF